MKRVVGAVAVLLLLLAGLTVHATVVAQETRRYSVAVTNLTRGQSFTPILVATHMQAVRMFLERV